MVTTLVRGDFTKCSCSVVHGEMGKWGFEKGWVSGPGRGTLHSVVGPWTRSVRSNLRKKRGGPNTQGRIHLLDRNGGRSDQSTGGPRKRARL